MFNIINIAIFGLNVIDVLWRMFIPAADKTELKELIMKLSILL